MKRSEFQIRKIQLLSLDFAINEKFSGEEITLDIHSEVNVMNSKDGENIAKVILTLNIFNKEDLEIVPFFIKLSIAGEFFWSDDIDETILETLLRSNAPAILLSYSRPFISQVTSYSGFPPLILPLLDFTNPE